MPPLTNVPPGPPPDASRRVAERVHLIHVTDRPHRPSLPDLLLRGEIPTSAVEYGYCGPNARFVEDQLGHPRSVYFYAGRAHPSYGRIALAFSPAEEDDRFHSATPFDSGGLVRPEAELDRAFRIGLNPDDLPSRVAYCQTCIVLPLGGWRGELARWLAAYYPAGPAGYWDQLPLPDPEGLYSSNGNSWPAWTWEARLTKGPSVTDAEAWAADVGYINELDALLGSLPLADDALSAIGDFRRRCITPEGSATFCEDVEAWTQQRCLSPT